MKRSHRVAAILGAATAAALVPATAFAHTTAGTTSCVLNSSDVPTITTNVQASSFGASGNGGGGQNTVRYEVQIDAATTSGQFSFPGTAGSKAVVSASTAGSHTVKVYTQWSAAETRDGNAQARTQVASASVTCPTPPTTPPPTPPTTPPTTTPPTTPPPTTPPVETPPAETPPAQTPPPVETPPVVPTPPVTTGVPQSAPSKSTPKKTTAKKGKKAKKHTAKRHTHKAKSKSRAHKPSAGKHPGFTG